MPLSKASFFFAAAEGDLATVRFLLEQGMSVNEQDQDGRSALSHAAQGGHLDVASLLLEQGANVDAPDQHDYRPLLYAMAKKHVPLVKLLLEHGANVDAENRYKVNPVKKAVWSDQVEILELLLAKGAKFPQENWRKLLADAVFHGSFNAVKFLLEAGAAVDEKDPGGHTQLWHAVDRLAGGAEQAHLHVAKVLLEYGANIDELDRTGRSPLWIAARNLWDERAGKGHVDLVKLLLQNGAVVDEYQASINVHLKTLLAQDEKYQFLKSLDFYAITEELSATAQRYQDHPTHPGDISSINGIAA